MSRVDMLLAPIFFRFLSALQVGASSSSVANTKKEIGLLTATFLLGLGALEVALHALGL